MSSALDEVLQHLNTAMGHLEAAVQRRIETERQRGDLETELQIMQDDRARLAVELDATSARLHRVETVTKDVSYRVKRAVNAVRDVTRHDIARRAQAQHKDKAGSQPDL
jgi:predicted  nucleic acid-binding Zn-ribbon protein